jgi:hypothetical protein
MCSHTASRIQPLPKLSISSQGLRLHRGANPHQHLHSQRRVLGVVRAEIISMILELNLTSIPLRAPSKAFLLVLCDFSSGAGQLLLFPELNNIPL